MFHWSWLSTFYTGRNEDVIAGLWLSETVAVTASSLHLFIITMKRPTPVRTKLKLSVSNVW